MAAVESAGTRSRIKVQYEKHEKFVGTLFLFPKKKTCAKRKTRLREDRKKYGKIHRGEIKRKEDRVRLKKI